MSKLTRFAPLTKYLRRHRRHIAYGSASALILVLVVGIYFLWDLPDPSNLVSHPAPASTKLLDRHGQLIYELFADQRRTPVKLSTLPKVVISATLAAEDKDFYNHSGFSLRGILRAAINTLFRGKLQGGSTITQQLAKNAFLTQDRTLTRKIRELALSTLIELRYTKDQILEFYLNQVPYGGTAYGIEAASQSYFNKPAAKLTLPEAALLAGLPQAPSYYSPFGSQPELAKSRQEYVLKQMLEAKLITSSEYDSATAQPLVYATPTALKAPHFSLWVKDLLLKKYGPQLIYEQGLIVTTTLDLSLQESAQASLSAEITKLTREHITNAAALITHPKTGEILAMIGSKDYADTAGGGNVNVVLRPRQPGSSIKPLTYSQALDRKLITPSTVLADKATCFTQANQKLYCPTNYDHHFHGPTQVRFALANSFNIPAVKALSLVGLSDFVASSSAYGITTFTDSTQYGPSITLGGGEVTMLDLSTAYGVLANGGQRVDLNPLLSVTDRSGHSYEHVPSKELSQTDILNLNSLDYYTLDSKFFLPLAPANIRVISSGAAFITSHILSDNGARSAVFGSHSLLVVSKHPEVSVKTGTTNDLRDNWTIGYNQDVLVAVWVGNNDNTAMSSVASGVSGASPIWNKLISQALLGRPPISPIQPPDVIGAYVCSLSGLRAPEPPTPDCVPRYEYFIKGNLPPFDAGPSRRDIPIYRPTQSPATAKQIQDTPGDVEYQNHSVLFDPLGVLLCLDCAGGYGDADTINLDRNGRATH